MRRKRPSPPLERFGEGVDHFREAAGITRQRLAEMVPISPGFMGQIIRGVNRCSLEVATGLDEALGAEGEIIKAWHKYVAKTAAPRPFAPFEAYEETATILRSVDVLYVYGMFQTEEYAVALLQDQENVKSRLARQAVLGRNPAPTLFAVMYEGVLLSEVGSREVMRKQLGHLVEMSMHENIHVQIAPFGHYRGVNASFTIASQEDLSAIAYVDNSLEGETLRDTRAVSSLSDTFARLQARVLNTEDSRLLIRKVIDERWT
ncbi:helix-turn-helix domain-containing protein [Actinomadura atramentaria]|uniref:helix-turn-helix domain-containing protein n=1 Tax=Actinomadura atramentaria TaxID=1990 RepID=UPI0003A83E85|nr:helix-turn-helix transcriptional regulator [Actinomadura atramentaria]